MLDWGDGCGEENGCEEMTFSSHHTETRAHAINMTFHCDVDLNHLVEAVPARCLLCKAPLFPLPVLYPLGGSNHLQPHPRVGVLLPLEAERLHKLYGIPLLGKRLFSPLY